MQAHRIVALIAAVLVALPGGQPAGADDTAEQQNTAAGHRQIRAAIEQEVRQAGAPDWAGRYETVSWPASSIWVAPNAGWVYWRGGICGLFDPGYVSFGALQHGNNRLQLTASVGGSPEGEYLVVRWGQRRYLVRSEEILSFCLVIQRGEEPRSSSPGVIEGSFFLRQGDEEIPVEGLPRPGFEKYATMGPIEAKVTKVNKQPVFWREPTPNGEHVTHTLILDAGTAEGLLPGMRLEVARPLGVKARVLVRKLSEHGAEADVLQTPSNGRIKQPSLAWRLKTREW